MRKLFVALLVVAVVLVGADIGGRLYAQHRAEGAISQHLSSQADPVVRIHGFSFLLQALPGRYSHVTVGSDHVRLGPLADVAAQVDLYDIDYPLSAAAGGTVDGMTIGRAHVRLSIPAAELGTELGVPDLTLSAAPGGAIEVHTSVTVLGESIPLTARVAVSLTGRTLHLAAAPASVAGIELPSALVGELQQRLTASVPMPQLPFGVTSATASASGGDLVISASAAHLTADQLKLAA